MKRKPPTRENDLWQRRAAVFESYLIWADRRKWAQAKRAIRENEHWSEVLPERTRERKQVA